MSIVHNFILAMRLICIFLLLTWITELDASTRTQGFAAMSIDFGSKYLKIGLVKPGTPMEIVLNKESRRKTPAAIYIKNGERIFGDEALALAIRHPSVVYGNLIDLVAKSIDHPIAQQYLENYPQLQLASHENRSTIALPFDEHTYSIEAILGMILSHARESAEAFAEQVVKDVVITVPAFFTQEERLAIVNAAKIAKLNLLQLINDGTAAALGHGVFRRKEISEKNQRLLIYDMGASKTVATLVEYKLAKDKRGYKEPHLTVLGIGYDRTLGGELITLRLRSLLVDKFRFAYKSQTDIITNFKAMAKIYKEAERVKQVLSANVEHYAQIESVHEDIDMRVKVTRDELNALIDNLDNRVTFPIDSALEMAGLGMDQVDQIVLMGAGTRVPLIQTLVQKKIGSKELGRFLNTDEAIAMGGLYQAAFLSKGFKVKTFYVEELQIYPVQVHFVSRSKDESSGEILERFMKKPVFSYKSLYPTGRKVMTLTSYTDDFTFGLHYGDLTHFTPEQRSILGSSHFNNVTISGLKKALEEKFDPLESEFKGVKVSFSLDYSGLVKIDGAEAIIEKKPKGVVESLTNTISGFFSGEAKKEEGETTEEKTDELSADSNTGSTEEARQEKHSKTDHVDHQSTGPKEDSINNTKTNTNQTTPTTTKIKLTILREYLGTKPVQTDEIKSSIKILEQFRQEEILRAKRHQAENELEAYVFDAKYLVDDEFFIKHSTEKEREKLSNEVARIRTWLEDDADRSTPTDAFIENLQKLKEVVVPIKNRITETENRPTALEELEKMINATIGIMNLARVNITETTAGFEGKEVKALNDEIDSFKLKVDKLIAWLTSTKEAQMKLSDNEDSVLKTEDLKSKTTNLQRAFAQHFQKLNRLTDEASKARKKTEREAKKKAAEEKQKEKDVNHEQPNEEGAKENEKIEL